MYFKQIVVPGMGCFSYVIGCPAAGAMAVVDPKRDIQDYLDISRREGMKITHIIETHVHADHVSGNQELKSRTGATIYMEKDSPVSFPFEPLKEGDRLEIGAARMDILETPGHTPNSLSVLVSDLMRSEEPWLILTGDVLFVGDIGRPDLVGPDVIDQQVRNQWQSLYVKFGQLPDHLEVFPAHGQGSLCGKGMSSKGNSTLGYERAANPMLQFSNFEDFHAAMTQTFPVRPKSFTHIIQSNMHGAPLLERCPMDLALNPDQFEAAMERGAVVIDTRGAASFGGTHIPGSINIGFEPAMANWVGMVVEPDADIILVVDGPERYAEMQTILHRIGYDRIYGWLAGGMSGWVMSGRPVERLPQYSSRELAEELVGGGLPQIIDVRTDAEWKQGYIPGSTHVALTDLLAEGVPGLKADEPALVLCGSGYRSNIAASHLQHAGFPKVSSLAGGLVAWQRAGNSVMKDVE
ncbi:MBL fold metallo-hydrolase [Desulfobaculum bizertense]|uniref:Glyoxylase, beta-lactamase superfamily II n=1 Tax=Desulfobaculum bizertense DSM 18034 TaxID=1121442 RepID=A0A1T4WGN5_9BACT|nr:MBL fold metallo-hydrolase [Desulfobaculum bizertense]SKA76367.1 Glyoxylase, beta-lactamase superfamily II [Desulfobaculum bizertense DSM 18034]